MGLSWGLVLFLTTKLGVIAGSSPFLTYSEICDPVSGACFTAFNDYQSHVGAWYECHRRGFHLAMPRTEQELNFINTNITGGLQHAGFWIGLTDYYVEGDWTWMDGVQVSYDQWKPGEPTDGHGYDEDCVEITYEGWNNARCTDEKPYLCQAYSQVCESSSTYRLGSYCYRLVTGVYAFSSYYCSGVGGTLAMPKNTTVNDYLYLINYEDKDMWIGLTGGVNQFVWIDSTVLTTEQAKFESLPPDPQATNGIFMTSGGYWDGIANDPSYTASYVCEIPAIDCGSYSFSNGVALIGETVLGTNRSYNCLTGYLPATTYTACVSTPGVAGNWQPTPQCIAVVDCGTYYLDNGSTISGNTTEGANQTYTCNTGMIANSTYTICQSNGSWEPIPACIYVVDCGTYYVGNGSTIYGNTTEGANQTYTCNAGMTANSTYTVCQSNGRWEPIPACINVVDCGTYYVGNGTKISGNTTEGANQTYTCNTGMTANSTYTVCQSNGSWEPIPACIYETNTSRVCYCDNRTFTSLTAEEQAEYYIKELTVSKDSLSSRRRQLTSAEDDRTSAQGIGISGVVTLSIIGLLICVPDLANVFSYTMIQYNSFKTPK